MASQIAIQNKIVNRGNTSNISQQPFLLSSNTPSTRPLRGPSRARVPSGTPDQVHDDTGDETDDKMHIYNYVTRQDQTPLSTGRPVRDSVDSRSEIITTPQFDQANGANSVDTDKLEADAEVDVDINKSQVSYYSNTKTDVGYTQFGRASVVDSRYGNNLNATLNGKNENKNNTSNDNDNNIDGKKELFYRFSRLVVTKSFTKSRIFLSCMRRSWSLFNNNYKQLELQCNIIGFHTMEQFFGLFHCNLKSIKFGTFWVPCGIKFYPNCFSNTTTTTTTTTSTTTITRALNNTNTNTNTNTNHTSLNLGSNSNYSYNNTYTSSVMDSDDASDDINTNENKLELIQNRHFNIEEIHISCLNKVLFENNITINITDKNETTNNNTNSDSTNNDNTLLLLDNRSIHDTWNLVKLLQLEESLIRTKLTVNMCHHGNIMIKYFFQIILLENLLSIYKFNKLSILIIECHARPDAEYAYQPRNCKLWINNLIKFICKHYKQISKKLNQFKIIIHSNQDFVDRLKPVSIRLTKKRVKILTNSNVTQTLKNTSKSSLESVVETTNTNTKSNKSIEKIVQPINDWFLEAITLIRWKTICSTFEIIDDTLELPSWLML
jgi:hypothetical protein